MLLITLMGTFAANLGTVVIVGMAIGLIHLTHHYLYQQTLVWALIGIVPTVLATFLVMTYVVLRIRQSRLPKPSGTKVFVDWKAQIVIGWVGGLLLLLELLLVTGLAAGVK